MLIIIKMLLVLTIMVILLKRQVPFGHSMFAATLLLFAITNPALNILFNSVQKTVTKPGTWWMLITLYLVMCLEHLLRTSGILTNFTASARRIFGSDRVLLGFMPAFLGFLPSLGGAIFSAPLVKEAGQRYNLSPERLTAINYWFRHIWEFCNPIVPAILLASELTGLPVGTLIAKMFIFSAAAALIGALVLLSGRPFRAPVATDPKTSAQAEKISSDATIQPINQNAALNAKTALRSILLAAGPIFLNLILVMVFHLNTALAMGLVLSGMTVLLKLNFARIKAMLLSSFDSQMLWGILTILFFQQMLDNTGTIHQIVTIFESSGIPAVAIICITAFLIGLLVGSPQGFVAVALPLVAALAPGNMDVIVLSYAAGLFGTMTSPAHLCQIVSYQYFKADYLKSLLPIIGMEVILMAFVFIYIYLI